MSFKNIYNFVSFLKEEIVTIQQNKLILVVMCLYTINSAFVCCLNAIIMPFLSSELSSYKPIPTVSIVPSKPIVSKNVYTPIDKQPLKSFSVVSPSVSNISNVSNPSTTSDDKMSATARMVWIITISVIILMVLSFVICLILYYSGTYNFGIGDDNVKEIIVVSNIQMMDDRVPLLNAE